MIWLGRGLAAPCIFILILFAGARLGAPATTSEPVQLLYMLLPLLAMVLVCLRMPSALPSIVVFLFGIVMDLISQEPLGYWPLVLLVGTALAKLHPQASRQRLILRLGWLVVVAGGVLLSFVVIESLYFLRMPAFDPFLLAMGVFVFAGWVLELCFALLGMVRLQVSETSHLVRGEG